jgi:hypothetical protein
MALDGGTAVDDGQFVAMGRDVNLVAGDDAHHRKNGILRLPTFGASTCVVMRDLGIHLDFDLV